MYRGDRPRLCDGGGNSTTTFHDDGIYSTAQNNSLLYRGYYFDDILNLYCVGTRYYDANIGRWINADGALYHSMLGYNMYAYCDNNPINYYDPTGESATAVASWWNTFGSISSKTPNWIDDIVWLIGWVALVGLGAESIEERTNYHPMWDVGYTQSFIKDGPVPQNIAQDTVIPSNEVTNSEIRYNPNPYGRPGEKKQNRENRSKSRKQKGWEPRNNRRDGKPAKPKSHTPSKKGHKKHFSAIEKIDLF